jgi:xylulose-5-phosphate/fructose-6-phosphate phosphoketolase
MACAGDVPTLETLAAVDILRSALPDLKIRVVNVVDLMTLESNVEHPHGFTDEAFDALFTRNKPVIFAYHGYPYLIHRLTYKRANHDNMHVHGFREEGTTTTPFDMVVLNMLDRFHLVLNAISRVEGLAGKADELAAALEKKLTEHTAYVREHGEDMPEIQQWTWPYKTAAEAGD